MSLLPALPHSDADSLKIASQAQRNGGLKLHRTGHHFVQHRTDCFPALQDDVDAYSTQGSSTTDAAKPCKQPADAHSFKLLVVNGVQVRCNQLSCMRRVTWALTTGRFADTHLRLAFSLSTTSPIWPVERAREKNASSANCCFLAALLPDKASCGCTAFSDVICKHSPNMLHQAPVNGRVTVS